MEYLRGLPFPLTVTGLFLIVLVRANATHWLGRAAHAGAGRTRVRRLLQSPGFRRAQGLLERWGAPVIAVSFLTVGFQTVANLAAGSYTVRVVSSTLPAGFVPTFDLDGIATAHTATVTLAAGQSRTDADFGYRTPPVACTDGFFKDHFNSKSFSNNDGSLSWTGPWIELDTAGAGPNSGNVTVGNPVSGYLILRDSPDTGTEPSAARDECGDDRDQARAVGVRVGADVEQRQDLLPRHDEPGRAQRRAQCPGQVGVDEVLLPGGEHVYGSGVVVRVPDDRIPVGIKDQCPPAGP